MIISWMQKYIIFSNKKAALKKSGFFCFANKLAFTQQVLQ